MFLSCPPTRSGVFLNFVMTEEQLGKLIDAVKIEGEQTRNTINSANSDNGCLPFIAMLLFFILMETCKL